MADQIHCLKPGDSIIVGLNELADYQSAATAAKIDLQWREFRPGIWQGQYVVGIPTEAPSEWR